MSPSLRQSEVFNSHQKGTGTWLLKTEDFQRWIGGQEQILFCPGIPGSGKTVLSSIIIDHIEQTFRNQDDVVIAYLFCDYRQQHTLVDLYSALLRQAIQRKSSIPERVRSFYKKYTAKSANPSKDVILDELRYVLASCARAFVVIDALDECPIFDGNHAVRHSFLRELVRLQNEEGFNLLATSRQDQEITAHFEGSASVEIQASSEDIQYYVDARLDDLPSFVQKREKLKQAIKDSITEAAKEMYEFICSCSEEVLTRLRFLLARLYFNLLLDESNEKGIRRMLEGFGTGSHAGSQSKAYDHAYTETMSRIERQGDNASGLAKKTIGWIINAKRNLTTAELEHALAIELETSEFDETNITDIEQLTSYCCGLVLVDEQTTEVKLVHYTTQKYFENTLKSWFPEVLDHITDCCLTYLSYDVFEEDRFEGKEEVKKIPNEYPFYSYSSLNWGHHFRESPGDRSILLKFLRNEAKLTGYDRCGFEPLNWNPDPKTSGIKAEHIAAFFNLDHLMQELLETSPDNLNIQDSREHTPLFLAVHHGHESVAKLLLNMGARVDLPDTDGNSPLHAAADQGSTRVVQMLLDKGADIEMKNSKNETPLYVAAGKGHDIVVTQLLDRGANVDAKEDYGRTALHAASTGDRVTIIEVLLSRGANLESKTKDGDVPLHDASYNGNLKVVKLFLEKGMSPEIANDEGETPLLKVSDYLLYGLANHDDTDATFNLLLNKGANTEAKSKHGETPLHRTAQRGWETPVKLLLDYGANVEAKTNDGMTPLHLAAQKERVEIVRMLLDRGASVDPMSRSRQTPLHIAASTGNEAIVTMLLDKAALVNVFDRFGCTPLFWSSLNGQETVSRLLLNKGANPNPPSSGPQPLPSATTEGGHDAALRALLEKESNPEQFNVYHQTAFHMASAGGHISMATLLLSAGAKPDTPDRYGRTPLFNAVCGGHSDMVQLLLGLPDVDKCRPDIWGLTPALEAQRRGLHEINRLLNSKNVESGMESITESSAEPTVEPQSTGQKRFRFCDVCLRGILEGEECYSCDYFQTCKFCPPVQTKSCPLCGNELVKAIYRLPKTSFADLFESCVCM
jgi:ankyrin repeat protein